MLSRNIESQKSIKMRVDESTYGESESTSLSTDDQVYQTAAVGAGRGR